MFKILILSLALIGCKAAEIKPTPLPEVVVIEPADQIPQLGNCEMVKTQVELRQGKKQLPTIGTFITESHYATTTEVFNGRKFPNTLTENIDAHLTRSCNMLKHVYGLDVVCADLYKNSWARKWTPAEHGLMGQAARGNIKPTPEMELWQGNLLFKTLPKHGTKYLVRNPKSGRTIVASFGTEVGPPASVAFGGLTVEAMWYLKAINGNSLEVGELKDQTLNYGPIVCGSKL